MITVVTSVLLWTRYADRQRTEALRGVAQMMGFTFEEDCGADRSVKLAGAMPLFDRGHAHKAPRMMQGRLGGQNGAICDYTYTTGGGTSARVRCLTVALFPDGAKGWPDLSLSPELVMHKLAAILGYQDIDFDSNEGFSKTYLLRGPDEAAIRAAFRPDILAYFSGAPGWHVQTLGGRLAVFHEGRFVPPDRIRTFVDDAVRIAGLFARR